jgi:hypothetical protein
VQSDTAGEQPVDIRAGVIESATGDPGQSHGESTDGRLIPDIAVGSGQSVATIDPDARP